MTKLVLVDGNSILFRAYYATSTSGMMMQSHSGLYTNALYGFVNMINKVIEITKTTHMLVAFDVGKPTFRHQEFPEYKGTRKTMPEELAMQIPVIKEFLDTIGIKRLELDSYEADDIIGTFAKKAQLEVNDIIIVSGDKDLLQLVSPKVQVWLTKKGISELEEYNMENFFEKMQIHPSQIIDYKGLTGDASDNLPGIRGVGPKTALNLLTTYGNLENIIKSKDELKGKLHQMVTEDAKIALKSKRLATIYCDIAIPLEFNDLKQKEYQLSSLRRFYEKVDFNSLIKKLEMDVPFHVKKLTTYINDFNKITHHFNENCYLEVELDGDNYHKANILGIAFVFGEKGFFLDESYLYNEDLIAYLENPKISKKTIDSKKTIVALAKIGIDIQNIVFDLTLASYVVNPSYPSGDLHSIIDHFMSSQLPYQETIYGKKSVFIVPNLETYAQYAIDKCYEMMLVEEKIINLLKDTDQLALLTDLEMPLVKVLAKMELNGFKINKRTLEEIGHYLTNEIERLTKAIHEASGEVFNVASFKQLGIVLFEKLKLGKGKKNKTGYSTSADVLEQLSKFHPVPQLVLEYRKYSKLYSTYVIGLLNEIGPDNKVHTIFKQALTLTGRLSSVEPNIQNIPIRSEDGKIIRGAFVPSLDYLISADYSQIELRVLAHFSNSKTMIDDFNHGLDLHTSTASKIYHIPLSEVTKEMRRYAKTVNFGIIYGMSDWGLSEALHISPLEAARFIDKYFEIYPEIKVYLDQAILDARELGYTTTLFKRRRYLPEITSSNHALRKFGERTAMNAPLQGTAADIIKKAMIDLDYQMVKHGLKSKMVSQVHDELVFDVDSSELEIMKTIIKKTMEEAVNLKVKLAVDLEVGKNWNL